MNLSQQLSITAKNHPAKTVYIFDDKETSYLELEGAVTKFAEQLEQLGYKQGDHLALVVGNSPYFIIGLYGALRMGAVIIPINPLYTVNEMAYILNNGDVKGVITLDVLMEKFVALEDELPKITHYITCDTGADVLATPFSGKMKSFTKLIQQGTLEYQGPSLNEQSTALIL